MIAGEDLTPPAGFDANRYSAEQVEARQRQSVAQLLAEMNTNLTATLAFIERLEEADLVRPIPHPRLGQVSAEFFLRHIGRHEVDDCKQSIGKVD